MGKKEEEIGAEEKQVFVFDSPIKCERSELRWRSTNHSDCSSCFSFEENACAGKKQRFFSYFFYQLAITHTTSCEQQKADLHIGSHVFWGKNKRVDGNGLHCITQHIINFTRNSISCYLCYMKHAICLRLMRILLCA